MKNCDICKQPACKDSHLCTTCLDTIMRLLSYECLPAVTMCYTNAHLKPYVKGAGRDN